MFGIALHGLYGPVLVCPHNQCKVPTYGQCVIQVATGAPGIILGLSDNALYF